MRDLPVGDHTPAGYRLPMPGRFEPFKRLVRAYGYPLYNWWNHRRLARRYGDARIAADLYLWGQRGNDYERQRRRVARYLPVQESRILVAGCGTGRDVESWVRLSPREIVGIDLFSYRRAWDMWVARFKSVAPGVSTSFQQGNLEDLNQFPAGSFDLISSDAVFEHVRDMPKVLAQFRRVLKPGGILYATFGPLWYGWGGDHVSGYDSVLSGFNHLTLEGPAYKAYLEGLGQQEHSEHDGRTWIDNDLFSRLKPMEYLECLEAAGFERLFVAEIIDPSAVACLRHSDFDRTPLEKLDLHDLLVSGMTIIYRR
ncbi:MAG: class I SAM-dependent methyltransferase [Proteobacteria bacterium]|nr:MAG: class I SAM-dependent methyltransferase [Pseudomonadota bacterium]